MKILAIELNDQDFGAVEKAATSVGIPALKWATDVLRRQAEACLDEPVIDQEILPMNYFMGLGCSGNSHSADNDPLDAALEVEYARSLE